MQVHCLLVKQRTQFKIIIIIIIIIIIVVLVVFVVDVVIIIISIYKRDKQVNKQIKYK